MESVVSIVSIVAGIVAIVGGIVAFTRWLLSRPRQSRPVDRSSPGIADAGALPSGGDLSLDDAFIRKEQGKVERRRGNSAEAKRLFNEAYAIHLHHGNVRGQANALMNRGILYRMMGEFRRAERDHWAADRLFRQAKDARGTADNLKNLGVVYRDWQRPRQAIAIHERALALYKEVRDRAGEAHLLQELGVDCGALGDPDTAERYLAASQQILRTL